MFALKFVSRKCVRFFWKLAGKFDLLMEKCLRFASSEEMLDEQVFLVFNIDSITKNDHSKK